jgi:hypothetical protein
MKNFKLDNTIKTGFTTPDNYFENFTAQVMSNLPQKEVKTISLWQRNKTWLYACASVVILFSGFWYFNNPTAESNVTYNEYLSYQNDVTLSDISEYLTVEDIESVENELNVYNTQNENTINENIY